MIGTTSSGISYQLRHVYTMCRCYWNVATYKWKVDDGKIINNLFCHEVLFLTAPYCQFRGVGKEFSKTKNTIVK